MEEQEVIEEMNQTAIPWLLNNILFCYEGKHTWGMTVRESSTSYNTKLITVTTRKPTLMN